MSTLLERFKKLPSRERRAALAACEPDFWAFWEAVVADGSKDASTVKALMGFNTALEKEREARSPKN